MERLTNHFDYCKMIDCKFYDAELYKQGKCKFFDKSVEHCHEKRMNDKLREYEDAEEQLLKAAGVDLQSMIGEFMHYYTLQKEGRLVELPCKVGQELFWNIQRYNEEKNIVEYVVEKLKLIGYGGNELNPVVITAENSKKVAFRFSVSAFGKRVFLSHEEAESALERMSEK